MGTRRKRKISAEKSASPDTPPAAHSEDSKMVLRAHVSATDSAFSANQDIDFVPSWAGAVGSAEISGGIDTLRPASSISSAASAGPVSVTRTYDASVSRFSWQDVTSSATSSPKSTSIRPVLQVHHDQPPPPLDSTRPDSAPEWAMAEEMVKVQTVWSARLQDPTTASTASTPNRAFSPISRSLTGTSSRSAFVESSVPSSVSSQSRFQPSSASMTPASRQDNKYTASIQDQLENVVKRLAARINALEEDNLELRSLIASSGGETQLYVQSRRWPAVKQISDHNGVPASSPTHSPESRRPRLRSPARRTTVAGSSSQAGVIVNDLAHKSSFTSFVDVATLRGTIHGNKRLVCIISSFVLMGFIYKLFSLQFATDRRLLLVYNFVAQQFPESELPMVSGGAMKPAREAPITAAARFFIRVLRLVTFVVQSLVFPLLRLLTVMILTYAIRAAVFLLIVAGTGIAIVHYIHSRLYTMGGQTIAVASALAWITSGKDKQSGRRRQRKETFALNPVVEESSDDGDNNVDDDHQPSRPSSGQNLFSFAYDTASSALSLFGRRGGDGPDSPKPEEQTKHLDASPTVKKRSANRQNHSGSSAQPTEGDGTPNRPTRSLLTAVHASKSASRRTRVVGGSGRTAADGCATPCRASAKTSQPGTDSRKKSQPKGAPSPKAVASTAEAVEPSALPKKKEVRERGVTKAPSAVTANRRERRPAASRSTNASRGEEKESSSRVNLLDEIRMTPR